MCSEDLVVEQLGENIDDTLVAPAVRPRNSEVILVCKRCQTKYTAKQFTNRTEFE